MPKSNLRIVTEGLPEQRFLEAIFRPEISLGAVRVDSASTPSAATGIAEYSLLIRPEGPVALVLNMDGRYRMTAEDLAATTRILLSAAPPQSFRIAWARPDVGAWIMADPRVRAAFEADEATRRSRHDLAARVADLPIDREAIAREFPEFRELAEFIERHATAPEPAATTRSSY